MNAFHYKQGCLHAEQVPLERIADRYSTPCYVYSRAAIEARWRAIDAALSSLPHRVCYAVKANANLAVLDVLARIGSGFDIVSGGELERVLAVGAPASSVVFSGVGKQAWEIRRALEAGVMCFNVESEQELEAISRLAAQSRRVAPVSLRVNPDVDARTHPYISTGLRSNKFGIPIEEAEPLYLRAAAMPGIRIEGVDCHIGSQLTSVTPLLDALDRVLALVERLARRGVRIARVDMGGGMGIRYRDEQPPAPEAFARAVAQRLSGRGLELVLEPGRCIVAEAGVLLTRVLYTKRNGERGFLVMDAAMNDLVRPALYQGWHPVLAVNQRSAAVEQTWDLVGPVCESSDFLAQQRRLAAAPGELLALGCCGAYGFAMSSNYNARPRAAEVLVDGAAVHLAREREVPGDLFRLEHRLPHE